MLPYSAMILSENASMLLRRATQAASAALMSSSICAGATVGSYLHRMIEQWLGTNDFQITTDVLQTVCSGAHRLMTSPFLPTRNLPKFHLHHLNQPACDRGHVIQTRRLFAWHPVHNMYHTGFWQ